MKFSTSSLIILIIALPLFAFTACKSGKKAADGSANLGRPDIPALIDSVAADNVITTASAARMPGVAPEYRRRQLLMNMATQPELVALFDNDNPVLRLTAFEGLYRRDYHGLDILFEKMIEDNTKIHYIKGDLSRMMPTLEYAYSYILGTPIPGEAAPDITDNFTPDYKPDPDLLRRAAERIGQYRTLRDR
jgi:hypothetical protein